MFLLKVCVCVLEDMSVAGTIELEKNGRASDDARGIAFSPDGEQLAVAITERQKGRIVIWDVKTGQLLNDFELTKEYDRLQ